MGVFRSKSRSSQGSIDHSKITNKDIEHYKIHSANVHDPILSAVNEAQPFEQAADTHASNRQSFLSANAERLTDVFGQRIAQPDVSNPTRSRNERPLDTIRAFEYAITGDLSYRDQLESSRLGWGFHEDFPHYSSNPYANNQTTTKNTVVFDGSGSYQQPVYENTASRDKPEQKKKRGLFGRKKK